MKARFTLAALVGAFALLALPAMSFAAEATQSGYTPGPTPFVDGGSGASGGSGGVGGVGGTGADGGVAGTAASGGEPVDSGSGTLAFTGQDIAFLLLSGVGLLLIGFGVRWLAWPRRDGPGGTAAG